MLVLRRSQNFSCRYISLYIGMRIADSNSSALDCPRAHLLTLNSLDRFHILLGAPSYFLGSKALAGKPPAFSIFLLDMSWCISPAVSTWVICRQTPLLLCINVSTQGVCKNASMSVELTVGYDASHISASMAGISG